LNGPYIYGKVSLSPCLIHVYGLFVKGLLKDDDIGICMAQRVCYSRCMALYTASYRCDGREHVDIPRHDAEVTGSISRRI
jgi:hypothetical protein